ncbi:MAG: PAS domain-containing protein [Saprospiraceae bacterium]|nr:PAS domain-containing protein [Saprospiraceae bacterium]HPG07544.1 PAS domain-containing protein [Saprospiraceae bacterium]
MLRQELAGQKELVIQQEFAMNGFGVEIILSRQLADCLDTPVFIVDPDGTLLFYNHPAESILGRRFEDTGSMRVEEWSTIFKPCDDHGNDLAPERLPLVETLATRKAAHGSFWIKGLDQNLHNISVTSVPVIGRSNEFSGAMAIFWTHSQDL